MKTMRLRFLQFSAVAALFLLASCGDDEEPQVAAPTVAITSPTDLSNLEVLVGSPLTFSLTVEAAGGLSSVSVNEESIKTYAGTETTDTFDYDFTATENGTFQLVFTVEDATGQTTDAASVTVTAVGDPGFLVADFGGAINGNPTTLSVVEPSHWDMSRAIFDFDISGNLSSSGTFEIVGNQATVETGVGNPDENADLIFQGNALRHTKVGYDGTDLWGPEGWAHIIFDFGTALPQEDVEALPQVNASLDGLTSGTKVFQVDVYYDDTVDPDLSFADLQARTDVWNADPARGILIDLTLVKHEVHRLNQDGSGMYIGYQGYVGSANEWITVTFDQLDLGRVGNFLAAGDAGKESPASNEVDGVRILVSPGYGDGGSANPVYMRNLRIVDAN